MCFEQRNRFPHKVVRNIIAVVLEKSSDAISLIIVI